MYLLTRNAAWLHGRVRNQSQRLTDFPLDGIGVDGTNVTVSMKDIPRNPLFQGTLDDDGTHLGG